MSNPADRHVLTADRRRTLRLLATGATRDRGMPWRPQRQQLDWLDREGYIVLGPPPPPTDGKLKAQRRTVEITAKGWEAVKAQEQQEQQEEVAT